MAETSQSLLDRLQGASAAADWERFVRVYTPLLRGWLRRGDVPADDRDDLVQDVLAVVLRELPRFRHNQRPGAFRCWLRTITCHRLRAFWKSRRHRPQAAGNAAVERRLRDLEDPQNRLSRLWDEEHDQHVLRRLLELMEPEFSPTTWQAFRQLALEGRRPAEVAAYLGMTVNAVVLARSRVLRRLRREAHGLID